MKTHIALRRRTLLGGALSLPALAGRRAFAADAPPQAASGAPPQAAAGALPQTEDQRLIPVFQSNAVWNAVATTPDGRVFVGFPQAGGRSVQVEELGQNGASSPYPDAAWNKGFPGGDPEHVFVHVNALRIGPDGALWIVDAGAPGIGKPAVRGAARIFRVDLHSNRISRIYDLRPVVRDTSYVDDIRFNGGVAYLTDAGAPALIVLDLASGHARRVLEDQPSTTDQRPLHADGKVLTDAQGKQVRLHADQLEVSPNGQYLYYQPASGPMSRIATQYLGDRSLSLADLNRQVEGWVDTPTTGGTAIDAQGNIYLSDTNLRRILRITPAREMSVLVADPRLIWPDAMWIDHQGFLWMPAAQLNLTPDFNGGKMSVQYPVWIYKMQIGVGPPAIDHA